MRLLVVVGIGGFIGTVSRYLISRFFELSYGSVFPWGTLIVNILGSLLLGIIIGISEKGNFMNQEVRLFLTVGICGGFTTFSSLSYDAFNLLRQQDWIRFSLYASLSLFLGLLAIYFGRLLIKVI